MPGTGCMTQLIALSGGGCVVTLEGRALDVEELFDSIEAHEGNTTAIVGDAFAKPMVRALDAEPDRWDRSGGHGPVRLRRRGCLGHREVHRRGPHQGPQRGPARGRARLGRRGRVAVGGHQPLGYYKDPDKTAATFLTVDGQRYSIPGDFATVEADGSITLLGRGSVCINTGGEKVFPEEVEEALKTHADVRDAVAVGVPDEKFGEAITAVVELAPAIELDETAIIAHVKTKLASYKAPKRVVTIDTIARAPNGKVDYKRLKGYALEELDLEA
jgi:fatty-acyl-CoA synthase